MTLELDISYLAIYFRLQLTVRRREKIKTFLRAPGKKTVIFLL